MDIICHTLTGTAVGTVVASFCNKKIKHKLFIIFLGTLGGALPDFDAISLGAKFDLIIGDFFNLKHSGKEIYFGKFWYSHHAALHSITIGLLIPLTFLFVKTSFKNKESHSIITRFKNNVVSNALNIYSFCLGFTFHLLEDMPTPHSVWGGVRLFFPFEKYFGGYGKIWWWNNYDLFLIIISCIVFNLSILFFPYLKYKKLLTSLSFTTFAVFFIYQINTREFDFNYYGHATKYLEYEKKSKEIQRKMLGDKLFNLIELFDKHVKVNF